MRQIYKVILMDDFFLNNPSKAKETLERILENHKNLDFRLRDKINNLLSET